MNSIQNTLSAIARTKCGVHKSCPGTPTALQAPMQPPKKKARRTQVTINKRLAKAKTVDQVADITKGFVPPNNAKNTTWAMLVFEEWRCAQNKHCTCDEICGANLLDSPDIDSLNFWMPRFVAEVWRQDGKPYLPKTVHQILLNFKGIYLTKMHWHPSFWIRRTHCSMISIVLVIPYTVHFTSKELGPTLLFLKLKRRSCGLLTSVSFFFCVCVCVCLVLLVLCHDHFAYFKVEGVYRYLPGFSV